MYNIMIFWQVDEELWSLKGATNIQKKNKKKIMVTKSYKNIPFNYETPKKTSLP